MYRTNFAISPRVLSSFFDDSIGAMSKVFHDDKNEYMVVPVNIKETDKEYELNVVAPGLSKEDFKIGLEKNVLTISYENKKMEKEESGKWIRNEYRYYSFKRSFTMNEKVDQAGINAKYADGVLKVTLPKKETSAPATQQITVA
jgi:HSP20 family protein